MATKTSSIISNVSVAADFRTFCSWVHDLFVTTGTWVNTADTGQIDLATVTCPGVSNTKAGYKIYRMADALQATNPVFIRVDFGNGPGATLPGLWFTIGTGSSGAGVITGIVHNGGANVACDVAAAAVVGTVTTCYGSSDTNRIHAALFVSSASAKMLFSIERSKDNLGADTGEGIIFVFSGVAGDCRNARYLILAGGGQPAIETGLSYVLSTANPTAFGGNVGVGVHIPMKGHAQQPGYGIVIVRANDFADESQFAVTMYGVSINYQHTKMIPNQVNATADSTARVCIRYN